jgi:hypothetical protein
MTNTGEDVEELEPSYNAAGIVAGYSELGKQVGMSLKR